MAGATWTWSTLPGGTCGCRSSGRTAPHPSFPLAALWQHLELDGEVPPEWREVYAPAGDLSAVWASTNDPVAMLALAGRLPHRARTELCETVAERLSFLEAFARLRHKQREFPPGATYNGPSLFSLGNFANWLSSALRQVPELEREATATAAARALVEILPCPTLAALREAFRRA